VEVEEEQQDGKDCQIDLEAFSRALLLKADQVRHVNQEYPKRQQEDDEDGQEQEPSVSAP
jgi:hypothetical protein